MVFTIAVVCAFWYYDVKGQNSIVTAYRWIYKSAFGSIVFAALLIAIVTFTRMIVDRKRKERRENKNVAVAICLCIVSCLLKQI
jgi:integral membrane sensor domain MASE1